MEEGKDGDGRRATFFKQCARWYVCDFRSKYRNIVTLVGWQEMLIDTGQRLGLGGKHARARDA
jgi:hypothetical protein